MRKHFHAVAVVEDSLAALQSLSPEQPLIVYGNHPSWWDPLVAQLVCQWCFPRRDFYAPIDAGALKKYRVLGKLGFFGVQTDSTTGAATFLSQCRGVLQRDNSSIWITPEGRFCDPRDREADWMPGLAHLCTRLDSATVLPLAMELPFWEEKLPELLLAFGRPMSPQSHGNKTKSDWDDLLKSHLHQAQDSLQRVAIDRDGDAMRVLLSGKSGAGAMYDAARRLKCLLLRKPYVSTHGDKLH